MQHGIADDVGRNVANGLQVPLWFGSWARRRPPMGREYIVKRVIML